MDLPPIAIPSYQRANILVSHTLGFLMREKYPPEKITIFVADQVEWEVYDRVLPRGSYSQLVVGMRGLLNQRRVIHDYYPEGQIILCADDDLKGIKSLRSDQNFLSLVNYGVSLLRSKKAGLFGILPNDDGRKLKEELTTHLAHILGAFFIYVNDKDCMPTLEVKHDYEMTILYYKKYGLVLRWCGAGVQTRYMGTPGGLQQPGRAEKMKECADYLLEKYPEYCKARVKKGTADLLLNWRAPRPSREEPSPSSPPS
jgi:hypothetical protein